MQLTPNLSCNASNYEDLACSLDERTGKNWSNCQKNKAKGEMGFIQGLKRVENERLRNKQLSLSFNNGNEWSIVNKRIIDRLQRKQPVTVDRYSRELHTEVRDEAGNLKGITHYVFVDWSDWAIEVSTPLMHLNLIKNV